MSAAIGTVKRYLVVRTQKHRVVYRRWWAIPASRDKREAVEAAVVEATDFDEEYGQVVDVEQLIIELEKRGWRR